LEHGGAYSHLGHLSGNPTPDHVFDDQVGMPDLLLIIVISIRGKCRLYFVLNPDLKVDF
jgi:hypothetical protein